MNISGKLLIFDVPYSKKNGPYLLFKNPKQNIGKQMLKAFFYAPNCMFTFEPIQKSTSIYNGLQAEPEMVVSLNVCVCVQFFFCS